LIKGPRRRAVQPPHYGTVRPALLMRELNSSEFKNRYAGFITTHGGRNLMIAPVADHTA
jgi:hypothetical protein